LSSIYDSVKKYHQHKDKWWALPLVLPCLLLPLFNLANTYTHVAGETVVLFLPMALMFSLMVVFGWARYPAWFSHWSEYRHARYL
jgi:hypothetical protein